MKLFNFISNNRIFPRKLSAILLPLVALSVLLLACSPSTNDSTIKTKVTLSSSSAILNAVKDTKVGTEKKITITKKPAGATGKWSISPKLPDGLALTGDENADTATLGGTPTESSEKKKYTVTFTGSGDFGSASTTIDVYVAKAKVTLSSSSAILNAVKDTKVETITITKKPAGATGTWSISPKLPDGLDLTGKENADTATLEGTPTETSEEKEYTVTFTGSGDFGSASTTIDVQVAKVGVSLTPPAKLSATKDARITPTSAITKSPTGATGKFSAILPAGLTIDGDTGVIKGTPEGTSTNTYDITFKGSGDYGNAQTTIEIEVGVLGVTLTQPTKLFARTGTEINPGTPIVKTTGATGVFSVVETLPDGLEIDKTTGAIKGTPRAVSSSTLYKIKFTGNGGYGDATTTIDIEVTKLPTLSLSASTTTISAVKDIPIQTVTITKKPDGAKGTWSHNLPSSLTFVGNTDADTATISGAPDTVKTSTTYTVTFTPSTPSEFNNATATASITLTVNELTLSTDRGTTKINALKSSPTTSITPLTIVHNASGATGTWSIDRTLPSGLTFNTTTGIISGAPDASATFVTKDSNDVFRITFTSGGVSANIDITVGVYKYKPTTTAKLKEHIEAEMGVGGQNTTAADLNLIDTSAITDMAQLFADVFTTRFFNGDVSKWDVSSVTTMRAMFSDADSFNGDISSWDVGNVTTMQSMFSLANIFNRDISNWDISSVTSMHNMFFGATAFNQDLTNWKVKASVDKVQMFNVSGLAGNEPCWYTDVTKCPTD